MAELNPEIYTVAWLAPLEIEARAAIYMLDNQHCGKFSMGRGDDYVFQAGDACGHNIVIATLPAGQEYGTGSAAALASQVKRFFPNLWFGLLVGVAAGLPNLSRNPPLDIRLGDVLVGLSEGESAGIIAYDLGKETGEDGFQLLRLGHALANTATVIRSAIGSIKLKAPNDAETFLPFYRNMKDKEHPGGTFIDPGQTKDTLYELHNGETKHLVEREPRPDSRRTQVWYGPIGSGDKLMKNARKRNELRDKYQVIGLEMEAAGTMNRIPVGVIRGVCDYGDEHKNKEWQPYAAAMAAAYAKAVLAEIRPKSVTGQSLQSRFNAAAIGVDGRPRGKRDNGPVCVTDNGSKKRRYAGSDDEVIETLPEGPQAAPRPLAEEKKRALLDSLRFDQIDARLNSIKKAHAKTCKWLLVSPEYLNWRDPSRISEHYGFLWIKGKPGAGKSTLMKFALADARKKMRHQIIISFFFNARGNDLEKSTPGLYRSLLLQLLERLPELECIFDSLRPAAWNGLPQQWSVELLKELFEQAVLSLGKYTLVCFVDALDECAEDSIRDMIRFFEYVGERATSEGIAFQVCFSSRHYPHITISKGLSLIVERQEGHSQDIVSYLDSELNIGHGKVAEQIRVDLRAKASGVFMWVVLVVDILQREFDHGGKHLLQSRLQDIPGDLHQLFRDILTRDRDNKDRLLMCIQWVLFARQPLKPEQLYFAILSGVDPTNVSGWDPNEIEESDIRRFILSTSKGLAEVTRSKIPTIQFIHESVNDFLKQDGLQGIWSDRGRKFEGASHERLKQCCLGYMAVGIAGLDIDNLPSTAEARQSADRTYPFLEYAIRNVLYHANAAEVCGVSQATFLQTFPLTDWIKHDNLFERYAVRRHTPKASLLYILAEHNLASLIGIHSGDFSCFKVERERYGPPIFAALATGSHEAVRALLRALAEAQPQASTLHSLCEQYYRIGSQSAGVGRDFAFSRRERLLTYLAQGGDEILFAIVLASGNYNIAINVASRGGRTPLSHAAEKGHEAVVRLLLDWGAAIDAADKDGRTPLLHAARTGHEAVVRLLLDRAAAIDAADKDGRTPLLHAARTGREAVVRRLLDRGAAIDAADKDGRTPVLHAAKKANEAVVRLLLDRGAAIDAADTDGRTPLSHGAGNRPVAIVRLLLDRGAAVDAADKDGQTPLSHAAESGHEVVVRLLLDWRAAIDAADKGGRTPLSHAAGYSFEATMSLARGGAAAPGTLTWHAGRRRNLAVVQLILDRGAVVDAADKDGRTPLSHAVGTGHEGVVRLLLDRGAAIDAADKDGRTPLSHAAETGHDVVVRLLLDRGAAMDAADKDGRTPLSHAGKDRTKVIVRLLKSRGAELPSLENY